MSWTLPNNKKYEEHLADVQKSLDWDSIKSEYNESASQESPPGQENRRAGAYNEANLRMERDDLWQEVTFARDGDAGYEPRPTTPSKTPDLPEIPGQSWASWKPPEAITKAAPDILRKAAEAAPEAITQAAPDILGEAAGAAAEAAPEAGSAVGLFFKEAAKTGVGVGGGELAANAIIGTVKTVYDMAKSPQGSIAPFLPGGNGGQGQDYAGMAMQQGILAALNKAGSIATRFGG